MGWDDLGTFAVAPTPVPGDDPRVASCKIVADTAFLTSSAMTNSGRMRDAVRAMLAHIDLAEGR